MDVISIRIYLIIDIIFVIFIITEIKINCYYISIIIIIIIRIIILLFLYLSNFLNSNK